MTEFFLAAMIVVVIVGGAMAIAVVQERITANQAAIERDRTQQVQIIDAGKTDRLQVWTLTLASLLRPQQVPAWPGYVLAFVAGCFTPIIFATWTGRGDAHGNK